MTVGKLIRKLPWSFWGPYLRARVRGGGISKFRRTNVGSDSYVDPSVQIFGWEHVQIGRATVVSEDSWLNASAREDGHDQILIGNNCHIGRRNYFSTGGLIELKDFAFTGLDCHLLGCGHRTDDPYKPYVSSGLTRGAPISLGVNVWLTTSVTVLEGVSIGYGSVVGARSVVRNSIPPFSIAAGNPAVTIKRFDFTQHRWVHTASYTEEADAAMPSEARYLAKLGESKVVAAALHSASTRFGWLR